MIIFCCPIPDSNSSNGLLAIVSQQNHQNAHSLKEKLFFFYLVDSCV